MLRSILNPGVCFLGLDDAAKHAVKYKYVLRICCYAARLCILQRRSGDKPPDATLLFEKFLNLIPLERYHT